MRELKDSGVEWIGVIPTHWKISAMKHIGRYINGYAFKPEDWGNSGLQIIRIQDLTGSNDKPNYYNGTIDSRYHIYPGDILISWAATLDAFDWCKGEGWLNQHIFKAIPNNNLITKRFFLQLVKVAMRNMNNDNKHGIVMQHVTTDVFNNFRVPLPSLSEQQRIADFLDRKCADIDDVLEKTRASIEEYKKLKQSVITKTIYHEDCSLSKLKYYGSFVNGYAFKSDSFKDAGTRVIKIANIQTGTLSWEDESFVDNSLYDQLTSFQVHKGDVVFALTRPIISGGIKTAIVDTEEKLLLNQRNAMFIGSKSLNNRYLYYTMQSQPFIKEFKLHIDLTGLQPNISTNSIANIAIPYRTILEQDSVVSYLDRKCAEIDSLINNKEKFIVELEAYRKSLIYEYVTGKKEVVS